MARWYSPSGLGPPTSRASVFMLKNHGTSGSVSRESSEHRAVIRPSTRSPSNNSRSDSDSDWIIVVMSSRICLTNSHASSALGAEAGLSRVKRLFLPVARPHGHKYTTCARGAQWAGPSRTSKDRTPSTGVITGVTNESKPELIARSDLLSLIHISE